MLTLIFKRTFLGQNMHGSVGNGACGWTDGPSVVPESTWWKESVISEGSPLISTQHCSVASPPINKCKKVILKEHS